MELRNAREPASLGSVLPRHEIRKSRCLLEPSGASNPSSENASGGLHAVMYMLLTEWGTTNHGIGRTISGNNWRVQSWEYPRHYSQDW